MTLNVQPFEVSQFHGGITDNYLDGDPHKYRYGQNFVITTHKKLYTRPGSNIYDEANAQIPLGAQRISTIINYKKNTDLLIHSARRVYNYDAGWNHLTGPSGNPVFETGTATTLMAYAEWNSQLILTNDNYNLPTKLFKDGGGNWQVRTAGLPELATTPTVTAGGAGAGSYLYAFIYKYEYTVGTLTYTDFGPVTQESLSSAAAPNSSAVAITAIPTLSNTATSNYDTANITLEIYRTIDGGDTFYFVTSLANGTASYNDSTSDSDLITAATLYTTGGIEENSPPPLSKYVHTTNGYTYYANAKLGSAEYPYRVYQSKISDPDSVPVGFYADLEEDIVGISSYNFSTVIGTNRSIYRLDGSYDDDGTGALTFQKLKDNVGLLSHNSFVQTQIGLFFAADDGFYWTDGYQALKLTTQLNARYKSIVANNPQNIYGTYDTENDRIIWAMQESDGSTDNDIIWCMDLNFGIQNEMPITTWANDASFAPSAVGYYNKQILRGDRRGYLFYHDSLLYSDPRVDTLVAASSWERKAIIYNYVSCAYKFGTSYVRKWLTRMVLTADNDTNLALQISGINDDGRSTLNLKPIIFKSALVWGDPDPVWGDPDIRWNYDGLIDEWRRFPATGIRCSYKQVQLTNAYVQVDSSDVNGLVTVDGTAKTATLVSAATADFPSNAVDYYISFENDAYTREYLITARTDDTVTFDDPEGQAPTSTLGWRMRGQLKNQVLNLVGYCLHYSLLGKTQKPYQGES